MTDREVLAVHEAAHAIAAITLHVDVQIVTLDEMRPIDGFGHLNTGTSIIIFLAGGSAERRVTGRTRYDADDLQKAQALLRLQRQTDGSAELRHYHILTNDLVNRRWAQITHVAKELLRCRRLSGAEVTRLAEEALT
jgi:hypothetical protein